MQGVSVQPRFVRWMKGMIKIRARFAPLALFSVQKRIALISLVLFVAAYVAVIGTISILRYTSFTATAFDLGNMDQVTWNTLHGHWLEFTNQSDNWYGAPIRLAQHVEPIFFLLALLYSLHSDPRILLLFQTLMMAAGSIPVYVLVRKYIPRLPLLAPLLVAGYLWSPALIGQNTFDFHPVTLATTFFLYIFLCLEYRRLAWVVILSVLAAACKEDIGAAVGLLGLMMIWKYRLPWPGLALFVGGMSWTLFAFLWIIPHFSVGAHNNNFWYRYEALGSTPTEAIINVLLHPWLPFTIFFSFARLYYLINLIRSTGFFALLAPEWFIPSLPALAINLLSSDTTQYSGVYHYSAPVIPFVLMAAIHGLRRFMIIWHGWRGEADIQDTYREKHALGYDRYAPGRPIPGLNALFSGLRILCLRVWSGLKWPGEKLFATTFRRLFVPMLTFMRWRFLHILTTMRSVAGRIVPPTLQWLLVTWIFYMVALNLLIMKPQLDYTKVQPQPVEREQHIQQLFDMIPPDASVSASGSLNPHLSERRYITVFPEYTVRAYGETSSHLVDYIIVDLDRVSPENTLYSQNFITVLNQLQRSGEYVVIAQAEGVVLLKRQE